MDSQNDLDGDAGEAQRELKRFYDSLSGRRRALFDELGNEGRNFLIDLRRRERIAFLELSAERRKECMNLEFGEGFIYLQNSRSQGGRRRVPRRWQRRHKFTIWVSDEVRDALQAEADVASLPVREVIRGHLKESADLGDLLSRGIWHHFRRLGMRMRALRHELEDKEIGEEARRLRAVEQDFDDLARRIGQLKEP